MEIVKKMVTEIGNLVHDQSQQLEIAYKNISNAKDKTADAKKNVM